jgi:hypothetical protein
MVCFSAIQPVNNELLIVKRLLRVAEIGLVSTLYYS